MSQPLEAHVSPKVSLTRLSTNANDELTGPRGAGYRRMIELSAAGRGGTPDEVGGVGALLMGSDGPFITGSDFSWTAESRLPTGTANLRQSNRRADAACGCRTSVS